MAVQEREMFKFYKSYYFVYEKLNKIEKLEFIDAVFNKEFFGIEPINLSKMVEFAYISQKHSIDKQVKGYEDYYKVTLCKSNPITPPIIGGIIEPIIQVKEEVKEEVKVKDSYINFVEWINKTFNRKFKHLDANLIKYKKALEIYTKDELMQSCNNAYKDKFHIENDFKFLTVEFLLRLDKIDKFLNSNINQRKKLSI